jgi:hypothetical protein
MYVDRLSRQLIQESGMTFLIPYHLSGGEMLGIDHCQLSKGQKDG